MLSLDEIEVQKNKAVRFSPLYATLLRAFQMVIITAAMVLGPLADDSDSVKDILILLAVFSVLMIATPAGTTSERVNSPSLSSFTGKT